MRYTGSMTAIVAEALNAVIRQQPKVAQVLLQGFDETFNHNDRDYQASVLGTVNAMLDAAGQDRLCLMRDDDNDLVGFANAAVFGVTAETPDPKLGNPTLRDEAAFCEWAMNNADPFGAAALHWAWLWMIEMETMIPDGKEATVVMMEEMAEHAAKQTGDTPAHTPMVMAMSAKVIGDCWEHGEAFVEWFRERYQLEGDDNASG